MGWQTVSNAKWKYTGYNYRGDLYLRLEYNDTTATPTSVSVRFVMYRADEGIKYSDGFGVLLNPVNSDGSMNSGIKFLKLKDATAGDFSTPWPADDYASNSFTLEKKYSEASFTLPPFWFINTWAQNTAVQTAALSGVPSKIFFYAQDTTGANNQGVARNYKTKFAASTWTIARDSTVVSTVQAHDPVIADNKNSTFSISVAKGTNGTNNEVVSTKLFYKIGDGAVAEASGLTVTGSLTGSASPQKVCAYSVVTGKYGSSVTSKTSELKITNYVEPNAPGIPELTTSSFKNNRLTIKQPWKYTWTAPIKTNDNSLVKGYKVILLKNDTTILTQDVTSAAFEIDPVENGFIPNDEVSIGVLPYAVNGKGDKLYRDAYTYSKSTKVQNAGVINLKTDDGWVEGQVYVKTDKGWQEAETVNVKTSSGWQESQ